MNPFLILILIILYFQIKRKITAEHTRHIIAAWDKLTTFNKIFHNDNMARILSYIKVTKIISLPFSLKDVVIISTSMMERMTPRLA